MNDHKEKSYCEYNEFRRPLYFHGMLLDDKDFRNEQGYHAGKRKLLNRMLHGAGVVCGLVVSRKDDRTVTVTQGLALDCCGNEIWVNKDVPIDLSTLVPPVKSKDRDACPDPDKPKENRKYYLAIRYEEKPTDPVSVYLPGDGCDERTCQNSRVKEGYCFEIVDHCPKKPRSEDPCGKPIPCPPCNHCEGHCHVILGQLTFDEDWRMVGEPTGECREYVITGMLIRQLILKTFRKAKPVEEQRAAAGQTPVPPAEPDPINILCAILGKHKEIEQKTAADAYQPSPAPADYEGLKKQMEEQKAEITKLQRELKKNRDEINKQIQELKNLPANPQ